MSGALPTTPVPRTVQLTSVTPSLVSVTHSLRRIVRSRGGQRWSLEFTYAPLTREEWAPIYAFLLSQVGQEGVFTVVPPHLRTHQGSGTGVPTVDMLVSAGATAVQTTWADTSTTVMKAGDLLTFSGGAKVYMLTEDAVSDGSGLASLRVIPELHADVTASETVTYTDVAFTVSLRDPDLGSGLASPGVRYTGLTLDLIEVLT